MRSTRSQLPARVAAGLLAAGLIAAAGCGRGGPETYPVTGRVLHSSGGEAALAGSYVEAVLQGDPTVRASGVIGPDGSFELATLLGGTILEGAREGTYSVRIIPNDEDAASTRRAAAAVAPRYLSFETSGLTLRVPPEGEVRLSVSAN